MPMGCASLKKRLESELEIRLGLCASLKTRGEMGGKDITKRQPTLVSMLKKIQKGRVSEFVLSYRCKASRTMSERSRLFAANNGPCMPTYVNENMYQRINRPQLHQPIRKECP